MKYCFWLLCFLLFSLTSYGQSCGTELTEAQISIDRPDENQNLKMAATLNNPVKLKITAHILRAIGMQAAYESQVRDAVEKLNQDFAPSGLSFEVCTFNYIDDPNLYAFNSIDEPVLASNNIPNTINIYFTGLIYMNGQGLVCGYTYYPSAQKDFVAISKECVSDGQTLTHEVGHFFGLRHTHEISSGIELTDGTNCSFSGDFLCDTPADPGLNYSNVNSNCSYIGVENDPNGEPYSPPVNNFMSYTIQGCANSFTESQYSKIRESYEASKVHLQELEITYFQSDTVLCPSESFILAVNGNASDFTWNTGITESSITVYSDKNAEYIVNFKSDECSIEKKFQTKVHRQYYFDLSAESICPEGTVEFNIYNTNPDFTYQLRKEIDEVSPVVQGNGDIIKLSTGKLFNSSEFNIHVTDNASSCSYELEEKKTVYVRGLPDLEKDLLVSNDTACKGTVISFKIKESEYNIEYQLRSNGKLIGNKIIGTGKDLLAGILSAEETKFYSVIAGNSCGDLILKDSVRVSVFEFPNLDISVHAEKENICSGETVQIQLDSSQQEVKYQLHSASGPAGDKIQGTGQTVSFWADNITSSQNFRIHAENEFGCQGFIKDFGGITIERPEVKFTTANNNIFKNDIVKPINFSNTDSHTWIINNGDSIYTENSFEPAPVSFSEKGIYYIKLVGSTKAGCMDSIKVDINVYDPVNSGMGIFCDTIILANYTVVDAEKDRDGNFVIAAYYNTGSGFSTVIFKVSPDGVLIWSKVPTLHSASGNPSCLPGGITIDLENNVYVIGNFYARIFQFGEHKVLTYSNTESSSARIFVIKFSEKGDPIWSLYNHPVNTSLVENSYGSNILVTKSNTLVFAGITESWDSYFFFKNDTVRTSKTGFLIETDLDGNLINMEKTGAGIKGQNFINPDYKRSLDMIAQSPLLHETNTGEIIFVAITGSNGDNYIKLDTIALTSNRCSIIYGRYYPGKSWMSGKFIQSSNKRFLNNTHLSVSSDQDNNKYISFRADTGPDFLYYLNNKTTDTLSVTKGECVLMKLDNQDNIEWYIQNDAYFKDIECNKNTGVFFTCQLGANRYYKLTGFLNSRNGNEVGLISSGQNDVFFGEYSSNGNLLWTRSRSTTGNDETMEILVHSCMGDMVLISRFGSNLSLAKYASDGFCDPDKCSNPPSRKILLQSLNVSNFCAGDSVTVGFSIDYLPLSDNTFTVELSDSAGNFDVPHFINSIQSVSSSIIKGEIPSSLNGHSYKLRVSGTKPLVFSDTIDLEVNPMPNHFKSVSIPNPEICFGDAAAIEIHNSEPGINYYIYDNGNMLEGPILGDGLSITMNADLLTSSKVFKILATSEKGCLTWIDDSVAIEVLPPVEASIVQDDTVYICNDINVILTVSEGNATWSTGEVSNEIYVDSEGDYSVTIVDPNNCISLDTVYVKKVNASISNLTNVTGKICYGDSVLLEASKAESYLWSTGETSQKIYINRSGEFSVLLTTPYCGVVENVKLELNPPFEVDILTPNGSSACAGDVLNLIASGGDSFMWSTHEQVSAIQTGIEGKYFLTALNEFGCRSTDSVFIQIHDKPGVYITSKEDTLLASEGITHQWYLDNNPIFGAVHSKFKPDLPGIYKVRISNLFGCVAFSNDTLIGIITDQKNKLNESLFLNVSPNPFGESFNLSYTESLSNDYIIVITDIMGREVYVNYTPAPDGENIYLHYLSSGVYNLRILSSDFSYSKKILKE